MGGIRNAFWLSCRIFKMKSLLPMPRREVYELENNGLRTAPPVTGDVFSLYSVTEPLSPIRSHTENIYSQISIGRLE